MVYAFDPRECRRRIKSQLRVRSRPAAYQTTRGRTTG